VSGQGVGNWKRQFLEAGKKGLIHDQVRAAFPNVPEEQLTTMTRCTAEYVEREWARLHNTTPPDSDDHGS
jgi:hypothetical protein